MLRIILGVVAGFIAWSIVWVGSDQVLMSVLPWYQVHQQAFESALLVQTPFVADQAILMMHLVRAIIISIMAGFIAAVVAGENRKSPIALGTLLLLFGIFVQSMAWNYLPVWYHLAFLALLIPMTITGGKMKQTA